MLTLYGTQGSGSAAAAATFDADPRIAAVWARHWPGR